MPRRPTRSQNSNRPTRTDIDRRLADLDRVPDGGEETLAAGLFPDPDDRPGTDVAALRKFMALADAAEDAPEGGDGA